MFLVKTRRFQFCFIILPLKKIQKDQIKTVNVYGLRHACRLTILSRMGDYTDDVFVAKCDVDAVTMKKGDNGFVSSRGFNTRTWTWTTLS